MSLTNYQEKTVEHLRQVFKNQNVYLVADEVGLGKTYIAKGLIKANNYKRIIYIASNPEIAKQNAQELGGIVISDIDRLSLLGTKCKEIDSKEIYVLPISPATSFTGDGSANGTKAERGYYIKNYTELLPEIRAEIGDVADIGKNEARFTKVRGAFCEYAVKKFKPDLIIMDEFHRFSKLLKSGSENRHYSLKELVSHAQCDEKEVKILLLSATPYVFHSQKFERKYTDDSSDKKSTVDEISKDQYAVEFTSFLDLVKFIDEINDANGIQSNQRSNQGDYYQNIFCRTERKWLQGEFEDVPIKDILPVANTKQTEREIDREQMSKHLRYRNEYISTLTIDESSIPIFVGEEKLNELINSRITNKTIAVPELGLAAIQSYTNASTFLDEAPEYAQFADGYVSVTRGSGTKGTIDELRKTFSEILKQSGGYRIRKKENSDEPDFERFEYTYGHAKWDMLKDIAMPEGSELRLWVPPTKMQEDFSKTIVFAHYRMSTRAIAALTSMEAQKRLYETIENAEVLARIPIAEDVLENLCEPVRKFAEKYQLEQLTEENITELKKSICDFFQTTYARHVLIAWGAKNGKIENLVGEYCKEYGWEEMLTEYMECLCSFKTPSSNDDWKKVVKKLVSSLGWDDNDRTEVLILPDWSEKGYPCTYGERYTADYSDKKAHDEGALNKRTKCVTTNRLEYIRERFQSPFYPFVLAASETAQEGVNLHNYCATIFHWSVPSRLNTFMQETGRVDRRASLTQRRQCVWLADKAGIKLSDITLTELFEKRMKEIYVQLGFDKGQISKLAQLNLFPYWFLPAKNEWLSETDERRIPQLQRVLFFLPLGKDENDYRKLMEELQKYHTFGIKINDELVMESDKLRDKLCPIFRDDQF